MKTYHNIEDLYREKFSGYAPQPPAEVWERIQSATSQKKVSVKGKIGIFATTVAVVAVATYFLIDRSPVAEQNSENQQNEQLIAGNIPLETANTAKEEVIIVQNEPSVATPKKTETFAISPEIDGMENAETPIVSAYNPNLAIVPNNHNEVVSSVPQKAEKEIAAEKVKINEKTEIVSAKIPPIVVSKDTTVCENSTVKLFVLNAKDVQWSTGERKNTIFVTPSSDEQFSATFSTENQQDTTIFIHIKCVRCSELFIPTAFTPNGDGLNDEFTAKSDEEYSFFEMNIYSRDGKWLFGSKDINHGWDGIYRNVLQPHGAYRYHIRYIDALGKMNEKTDYFLLILQ